MADPLSVAASLVALATFAFQSSVSLYQLVDSFKSSKRAIRELREELEALAHTLEDLQKVAVENETTLAALKLPLRRCAKICRDFESNIRRVFPKTDQQGSGFRDWAKLNYLGNDITDVKNSLAGYKLTICIALGGATFKKAAVTTNVLEEYKQMISHAVSDIHEHLNEIDERTKDLHISEKSGPSKEMTALNELKEEKESLQHCLDICSKVSTFIKDIENSMQPNSPVDGKEALGLQGETPRAHSQTKTRGILTEFQGRIANNASELKSRLRELDDKISILTQAEPDDQDESMKHIRDAWDERASLVQCLDICADASKMADAARTNELEDIVSADNSRQIIVSTIGDLVSARHIVTGSGSLQCVGQMSDETIQHLSWNGNQVESNKPNSEVRNYQSDFDSRYGAGYQIREPPKRK